MGGHLEYRDCWQSLPFSAFPPHCAISFLSFPFCVSESLIQMHFRGHLGRVCGDVHGHEQQRPQDTRRKRDRDLRKFSEKQKRLNRKRKNKRGSSK